MKPTLSSFRFLGLIFIMLMGTSPLYAQDAAPAGPTLSAIDARGQLICGTDQDVYGFGFLNTNTGDISGLYMDFCKALAVATLGEVNAVDIRFQPLRTTPGVVTEEGLDVLFSHSLQSNLTAILSTDSVTFSPVTVFYDTTSVMSSSGNIITDWDALQGQTVCVQYLATEDGTTPSVSAQNFAQQMAARALSYDETSATDIATLRETFLAGRCAALVLERSLLEIMRQSTESPQNYTVWSADIDLRPVHPLYSRTDTQWQHIVDSTLWALIAAEEYGITSDNIDDFLRTANESDTDYIRRVGVPIAALLDAQLGLGNSLGLRNDFAADVIRQVGNYGEIYDRHLGPDSPLTIERGINALWRNGGLLHSDGWR